MRWRIHRNTAHGSVALWYTIVDNTDLFLNSINGGTLSKKQYTLFFNSDK